MAIVIPRHLRMSRVVCRLELLLIGEDAAPTTIAGAVAAHGRTCQKFFFEEAALMMELPKRHATPFKGKPVHMPNVHALFVCVLAYDATPAHVNSPSM